jgi:endonuclease/exonuclease/phosphatase (EEP) superfamily protein YafD
VIGEAVTRTPPASQVVASGWPALGWLVVLVAAGLWLLSVVGYSGAWPVVVLQSALPVVLLPAAAVGALAATNRRWWLAGASLLVVVAELSVVVPLTRRAPQPAWVAGAPTLTLLEANLYFENPEKPALVKTLLDADADVLALAEVTQRWVSAFEDGGLLAKYPYQILRPFDRAGSGAALLSRIPFDQSETLRLQYRQVPSATVTVGGRAVRVVAVHAQSPSSPGVVDKWASEIAWFAGLRSERGDGRMVLAGDYNATYWHAPFRTLLTGGWRDAHHELGRGMDASWPDNGVLGTVLGPYTRLDHAVLSPGVVATALTELELPGSDHRGFVVTLALGP